MRKISAMYKYSGGTEYRHNCHECKNCIKIKQGSRFAYKCMIYGDTGTAESDWKISYIACRLFNKPIPAVPVIKAIKQKRGEEDIPGQISFEDIPGVIPQ